MQPMLAKELDFNKLKYPVYVSPKLDGIRGVVDSEGILRSRTWKPLPNRHVQLSMQGAIKSGYPLHWLDGELVVGLHNASNAFNASTSGIMSADGIPDVTYWIFDRISDEPYQVRLAGITGLGQRSALPHWIKVLPQTLCSTRSEVEELEAKYVSGGYEGVIVRSVLGRYKFGRSTVNEGLLLKLKRFQDAEAVVIGVEELMHNMNEPFIDAQGHTKHTSHKAGKVPGGVLGALVCEPITDWQDSGEFRTRAHSARFSIGTGFDMDQRIVLWRIRDTLMGRIVKYKSQPHGALQAPRFPVFLGFRSEMDM